MRVRIFTRMWPARQRSMSERRVALQPPVAAHTAHAFRSTHACRKAGALATIIVAASLALAASRYVAAGADTPREQREWQTSQDCSARYAALLDLAELARRDGKSSEVVVRGLSDRAGAMSACLPTVRVGQPGRGVDATKKSAPDS